ncbi:MAG: amidohydrolase [Gulosibacter sp.]|uniref:amidohydrolase n=1 Tax=Gulosibacter sp. TaxID=2817531 RepID=UPI003F8E22F8
MEIDLIVEAKRILTLDAERPTASRMGVLGGKIVGFDEELDAVTSTNRESFPDQVLVPGFIDAHCHTTWWGLGLTAVQLDQARGLEELYAMIEAEVERVGDDSTAWIHGTGFNQKHHDGAYPDIARLDEITGEHPLYLRHTSGHAAITNTATLRMIGALDEGFENPVGGEVVRNPDGSPTGLLDEAAQSLIQSMLLPYSSEEIARALDAATSRFAAQGITSFSEAGIGGGWIGHSPIEVAGYQLAKATDRLHARAQVMPAIDSLSMIEGNASDFRGEGAGLTASLGVGTGFGTEWIKFGHVKAFMDGSLLGTTAAVTEDYCGHDHNRGYLLNTPEQYRIDVLAAYRAGWPVALHAIGDAGIDMALELIEECQQTYGSNGAPNRIEHFGIARPDQVERAGRLKITVTPQAGFIGPLGDQFAKNVGPERENWLYRGRSIVDAGAILAGSSDLPVADNNIRRGMQSAVDRLTENGMVLGPDEGISPEEALRSYTEWGALGTGQIAEKGTLERGKLADFVVLSDSPLTCENIAELDVVATFVGGTTTFDSRNTGAN